MLNFELRFELVAGPEAGEAGSGAFWFNDDNFSYSGLEWASPSGNDEGLLLQFYVSAVGLDWDIFDEPFYPSFPQVEFRDGYIRQIHYLGTTEDVVGGIHTIRLSLSPGFNHIEYYSPAGEETVGFFTKLTRVPEPSTLIILCLGLVGIAWKKFTSKFENLKTNEI